MAYQYSLFPETSKEIAIVDIETTGFLRQKGLIVEIGIASLNLESGEIKEQFGSLVREPGLNNTHTAPPYGWIFNNSDLRYEDVCKAPLLEDQMEKIQKVFDKFTTGLTAYNASFDLPFLRSRGFQFKPLPCPMIAATPVINLPPARGRNSPKWPSVEEAWHFFFSETEYIEKHRALDDAVHEAKIVYELHKIGKYPLK